MTLTDAHVREIRVMMPDRPLGFRKGDVWYGKPYFDPDTTPGNRFFTALRLARRYKVGPALIFDIADRESYCDVPDA